LVMSVMAPLHPQVGSVKVKSPAPLSWPELWTGEVLEVSSASEAEEVFVAEDE